MTTSQYVAPAYEKDGFNCPHCHAYSKQDWPTALFAPPLGQVSEVALSRCHHCGNYSVWYDEKLIFPWISTAPYANADLPDDMKRDYEEARNIANQSPRGAAALLRLIIQKLCKHLGEKGDNPNDDIAALVRRGLPAGVQKALDSVRVIGNEAVHPGTIDLRDNPEITARLFGLVNFITEKMVTEPKTIEAMYASLPPSKLEAIKRRDK